MKVSRLALVLGLMAFPLSVPWLLDRVSPGWIVGVFGLLITLRLLLWRTHPGLRLTVLLAALLFVAAAVADPALQLFRLYPALVNCALATACAYTLVRPPSAMERLSRAMGMTVSPPGVIYTRRLTAVWLAFFLGNAGISLYTTLFASLDTWALYNGFVSYGLTALLIVGEYPVRRRYQRLHHVAP
ncbi:MAG: hypothetical protein H6993_10770 [Pseudomonadales bacterium]|nr:hypothetical protein [Pseudomonadales bacterium]MCP5184438.1 hypothetical protein [Pseudomonadales bacterium]